MKQVAAFALTLLASPILAEQFCMVGAGSSDGQYSKQVCFDTDANSFTISDVPEIVEDGVARPWSLAALDSLGGDLDIIWILVAGVLVFFMQCGFAMLEAGSVQEKNVLNIIYKNFMDVAIASITFFLVGYAFAYGDGNDNAFIGGANFALVNEELNTWHSWFFQFAFAATASTIVSGSVAERCAINAYYIYSFFMSFIIYPVVVHWVWDTEGWISAFNPDAVGTNGLIDFAGSGVVHMVGGFAGLTAAKILGPRLGRFDENGKVQELRPHSVTMQALGTLILWTGWYGFNCGSTLAASGGAAGLAGRVAVTTTLAAGSAAIAAALIGIAFMKDKNPTIVCNGVLAGLVSITAGCATVTPGSAIAVGFIGGLLYYVFSKTLLKLQIDDPLDAFPVHGGCGMWGVLAVGIFSQRDEINDAYSVDNDAVASGEQFGIQLLGVVAIAGWTIVTSTILFTVIKMTVGFRVDPEIEAKGLDITEHGGVAYTRHKWKHVEMVDIDSAASEGLTKSGPTDSSEEEDGVESSSDELETGGATGDTEAIALSDDNKV